MHHLITFLGANTIDSKVWENDEGQEWKGYGKALWQAAFEEPLLFGYSEAVSEVWVFGTTQSLWSELYSSVFGRGVDSDLERELKKLSDYTDSDVWQRLQKELARKNIYPLLVDEGFNETEQINMLKTISESGVKDAGSISIDVTHSYRHLPLMGVVIALFLKQKNPSLEIKSVFYGAAESETESGNARVVKLDGMLCMIEWVMALNNFDKDGDYGVFVDLLKADGFNETAAEDLKGAAFSERAMHLSTETGVVKRLRKVHQLLEDDEQANLKGMSGLFKNDLQEHLKWCRKDSGVDEQTVLYKQQKTLAYAYLDKRNYIQATIFALESIITKHCDSDKDMHRHNVRDNALSRLSNPTDAKYKEDVLKLKELRNHFAHAKTSAETHEINGVDNTSLSDKRKTIHLEIKELFKSEENLREYISNRMVAIL